MLRSGLVLLSGCGCGKITDTHVTVAAIVEMIHNATLLHDDVVDDGQIRRGAPTINRLWGNESAVLLGDYLLGRVFKMSADLEPPIAKIIATIAVRVCDGELRQALQRDNWQLSEAEYIDIITGKSAAFFSGCCQLGAILADAPDAQVGALADFGLDSGIAFQITDDLLDITGSQNQLGKNTNKDAVKSRLTLPVIHLLSVLDQTTKKKVHDLLHSPAQSKDALKEMLVSFGSLNYARDKACQFVAKAIERLNDVPSGAAREALIEVAQFTAHRAV
jgi:octaprenyl-diphosphate synthase